MKIESYQFGKIVIDGRTYFNDIIIYPDHIDPSWFRKEGHEVQLSDLSNVWDVKPATLIIGTGYSGLVKIRQDVINYCKAHKIAITAEPTKEACRRFNNMKDKGNVVFALHLTC